MTASPERIVNVLYGPAYLGTCGMCSAERAVLLSSFGVTVFGRVQRAEQEEHLLTVTGEGYPSSALCWACIAGSSRYRIDREKRTFVVCRFCWATHESVDLIGVSCRGCGHLGEPPALWWQRDDDGRLLAAVVIGLLAMHAPMRAAELRRLIGGDPFARPWQKELQLWPWMLDELVVAGYLLREQGDDHRRGFQRYGVRRSAKPQQMTTWLLHDAESIMAREPVAAMAHS